MKEPGVGHVDGLAHVVICEVAKVTQQHRPVFASCSSAQLQKQCQLKVLLCASVFTTGSDGLAHEQRVKAGCTVHDDPPALTANIYIYILYDAMPGTLLSCSPEDPPCVLGKKRRTPR